MQDASLFTANALDFRALMNKKISPKVKLQFFLIQLLKKFGLPKKRHFTNSHPKVLIISNTGIGDTMWGTPALKMLKKTYPDSSVTVLTSLLSQEVLKNNPYVDETILFKKGGALPLLWRFFSLYRKKFDSILIFHTSLKWLIPVCYFLSPKNLIAFEHDAKEFQTLLTQTLVSKLHHPIIQRNMLVEKLGVKEQENQMELFLTQKEYDEADQFLKNHHVDLTKPLIGFQPGASNLFKCWPLQHFKELAHLIEKKYRANIIIFGNKDEMAFAQEINGTTSIICAAGALTVRTSAALLSKLHLLVTNDTGPMHLAIASKIPMIAIFGPTPVNLCWPHQEAKHIRIISRPMPCQKCVRQLCMLPFCLEQISPQEVFENIEELLNPQPKSSKLACSVSL